MEAEQQDVVGGRREEAEFKTIANYLLACSFLTELPAIHLTQNEFEVEKNEKHCCLG